MRKRVTSNVSKVSTRQNRSALRKPPLPPDRAAFVQHYVANGGNGTRAYLAAFPTCHTISGAAANAYKLLRLPVVASAIDALQAERWKAAGMTGEEAMARIALDARGDPRELYDDKDKLLPIRRWPDSVAQSVKSIRTSKDGSTTVTLNDSLAARKLIAEQTGKLKNPLAGVGDLAKLLAGDFEEDE
jgi:Terminase small subunit